MRLFLALSPAEISKLLPEDITIACYNSADSVTISGPPESINDFTEKLQSKGIFARGVNSSGYAFHSKYIAQAGTTFQKNLENVSRGIIVINQDKNLKDDGPFFQS